MMWKKPFDENMFEMEDIHAAGLPYLSPTSLGLFWDNREAFYMSYIMRVPRPPATLPMLVGSAFDAYVKAFLGTHLFGADEAAARGLELSYLLDEQVGGGAESSLSARAHGREAFRLYTSCGALADLMLRIGELSRTETLGIRFEGDIIGDVDMAAHGGHVRFRGKPDMSWTCGSSTVILDWKVNGWCSSGRISPMKGYRICRPSGKVHKLWSGGDVCMSTISESWARQLCIYGWLLGAGSDCRVMIDQIVGRDRVAHHEARISVEYQEKVMQSAQEALAWIERGVWPKEWRLKGEVIKEHGNMFR